MQFLPAGTLIVKEYLPVANAMAKGLALLRTKENFNWTYLSPSADFIADGEKRNRYQFTGEVFTTNEKGESAISYLDYASVMLNEIENGKHIRERISVFSL